MGKNVVHPAKITVEKGLQTGPFGSQLKANEYTETGIPIVMPKYINSIKISTVAADGKDLWKHIVGIFVILGILNISIRYSGIRNLRIAGGSKLFDTTKRNIFEEGELLEDSVVKESLTTALDGKQYQTCVCLSTYNNPVYGLVLLCANSITPEG